MKQDALEESYRAYRQDLYLYALSLCRDPVLADELTAETFYRALLSLEADASSGCCGSVKIFFMTCFAAERGRGTELFPRSIPTPRRACWNS